MTTYYRSGVGGVDEEAILAVPPCSPECVPHFIYGLENWSLENVGVLTSEGS